MRSAGYLSQAAQTGVLERSYLIQRLKRVRRVPEGSPLALLGDNPFSFGGGLRNGGLSDDAMGLIRDIFAFDYMGSAEFEFGSVPEALQCIAKYADEGKAVAGLTTVALADVPPNWRIKHDAKKAGKKPPPPPEGRAKVYYICHRDWVDAVEDRIGEWATTELVEQVKEQPYMARSLRPYNEWDDEVQGWLELSNGFFVFTDYDMLVATARLFGVEEKP